jgi:hypothetical protein
MHILLQYHVLSIDITILYFNIFKISAELLGNEASIQADERPQHGQGHLRYHCWFIKF